MQLKQDGKDLLFLKTEEPMNLQNIKSNEVAIDNFAEKDFKKLIDNLVKRQYEEALKHHEKLDGLKDFLDNQRNKNVEKDSEQPVSLQEESESEMSLHKSFQG